ncbi:MAG: E3 binding domain-containing protein [Parcubacteria group bacterium]|nr:E3 binding domain-containing protein [Parcubacteria group bacterium]
MTRTPVGILVTDVSASGKYSGKDAVVGPFDVVFKKKAGDRVEKGDLIATVELEKVTVDIEAPEGGTLVDLFQNTEWVNDGKGRETPGGAMLTPVLCYIQNGADSEEVPVNDVEVHVPPKAEETEVSVRPLASPRARSLAREKGVDLAMVAPSGPDGAILARDVAEATPKREEPKSGGAIMPLMVRPSHAVTLRAHALEKSPIASAEVLYDLSWLYSGTKHYAHVLSALGEVTVTPLGILALAVTETIMSSKFSELNGYWQIDPLNRGNDSFVLCRHVNLGIIHDEDAARIDPDRGVVISGMKRSVLTLQNAQVFSRGAFLRAFQHMLEGVRTNAAPLEETQGHTFIVSSLGALKHTMGVSFMKPGVAGLVNVGHVDADGLAVLQMFFDRRMTDGSIVYPFLDAVIERAQSMFFEE